MYSDENGGLVETEDGFSQSRILPNCNNNNNSTNPNFSMEDQSCTNNSNNPQIPLFSQQQDDQQHQVAAAAAALEMELQQQLNLEMDQLCNNNGNNVCNSNNNDIQTQVLVNESGAVVSTWQEMAANFQLGVDQYHPQNDPHSLPDHTSNPPPDLLNIFPFPRCPSSSSSSIKPNSLLASLGLLGELNPDGSSTSSIVYDPLLIPPLNLPPQPPALLRDLFHSLPHGIGVGVGVGVGGYNTTTPLRNNSTNLNNTTSSLFGGGMDEMMRDNISIGLNGGLYPNQNGVFENGVFEFTAGEMDCLAAAAAAAKNGKDTKHFATERHRRVLLNDKYQALRKLVPNPTKNDRASIVGDAIDYINELKRTVSELKVLVEKKRCAKERLKRPKSEDESTSILLMEGQGNEFPNSLDISPYNNLNNGSNLRCSWLHRKSKNTEVDVRIIDDEVTVKLVQQKRINCLLFVSKVLDDFHLDLHHVAGGLIGDYYSFLFNSKICEGSIVYASAVANKLVEVVDKQYAAILPTSSY